VRRAGDRYAVVEVDADRAGIREPGQPPVGGWRPGRLGWHGEPEDRRRQGAAGPGDRDQWQAGRSGQRETGWIVRVEQCGDHRTGGARLPGRGTPGRPGPGDRPGPTPVGEHQPGTRTGIGGERLRGVRLDGDPVAEHGTGESNRRAQRPTGRAAEP
jgi:hypothetical protein